MNRREFIAATAALATTSVYPALAQSPDASKGFPASVLRGEPYIETEPIPEYHSASPAAYEAFQDMKFGARYTGASIRFGIAATSRGLSCHVV